MKIRNRIIKICYYINIIMLFVYLNEIILKMLGRPHIREFCYSEIYVNIKFICLLPVILLTILLIVTWAKKDKSVGRFFLLFFLNGLYNPFYYWIAKRKGWLQ